MFVIRGRNAPTLWPEAIRLLTAYGVQEETRNGPALVLPEPCTIVYERPEECVVVDPVRDANPIMHLHEAIWMLAGRNDAKFIDQFVGDFSKRYAEPNGLQHGAYGYRWRQHFSRVDGCNGEDVPLDQLDEVVRLLRANPDDRQAILQMWDPAVDLGVPGLRDRPCNLIIALRVRTWDSGPYRDASGLVATMVDTRRSVLDITVFCRSNDLVYGTFGANCVHFSVLQQYLAARIGVGVGTYRQVSNNLHMYLNTRNKADWQSASQYIVPGAYPGTRPLVDDRDAFDDEVREYCDRPLLLKRYRNTFLTEVAQPQFLANEARRDRSWAQALGLAGHIAAPDWRAATVAWLERRARKAGDRG